MLSSSNATSNNNAAPNSLKTDIYNFASDISNFFITPASRAGIAYLASQAKASFSNTTTEIKSSELGGDLYNVGLQTSEMLVSPEFKKAYANQNKQAWYGFFRHLDPNIYHTYLDTKQIHTIENFIRHNTIGITANTVYSSFVKPFYESTLRSYAYNYGGIGVGIVSDIVFYSPFYIFLNFEKARAVINAFLDFLNTVKAANNGKNGKNSKEAKACPHGMYYELIGKLSAFLYSIGELQLAEWAAQLIEINLGIPKQYTLFLFNAFIQGRDIVGSQVFNEVNCVDDYYAKLNQNNTYVTFFGFYFMGVASVAHVLTEYFTGIKNEDFYSYFFSLWKQFNTALSILVDKPLPGEGEPFNYLAGPHAAFNVFLKNGLNLFIDRFPKSVMCDVIVTDKYYSAEIIKNLAGSSATKLLLSRDKFLYIDLRKENKVKEIKLTPEELQNLKNTLSQVTIEASVYNQEIKNKNTTLNYDTRQTIIEELEGKFPKVTTNDGYVCEKVHPDLLRLIAKNSGFLHPQTPVNWLNIPDQIEKLLGKLDINWWTRLPKKLVMRDLQSRKIFHDKDNMMEFMSLYSSDIQEWIDESLRLRNKLTTKAAATIPGIVDPKTQRLIQFFLTEMLDTTIQWANSYVNMELARLSGKSSIHDEASARQQIDKILNAIDHEINWEINGRGVWVEELNKYLPDTAVQCRNALLDAKSTKPLTMEKHNITMKDVIDMSCRKAYVKQGVPYLGWGARSPKNVDGYHTIARMCYPWVDPRAAQNNKKNNDQAPVSKNAKLAISHLKQLYRKMYFKNDYQLNGGGVSVPNTSKKVPETILSCMEKILKTLQDKSTVDANHDKTMHEMKQILQTKINLGKQQKNQSWLYMFNPFATSDDSLSFYEELIRDCVCFNFQSNHTYQTPTEENKQEDRTSNESDCMDLLFEELGTFKPGKSLSEQIETELHDKKDPQLRQRARSNLLSQSFVNDLSPQTLRNGKEEIVKKASQQLKRQ